MRSGFDTDVSRPEMPGGFTLVELIVTIAVAGILLTVAVPGFKDMISSNRQTADVNTLVSALNLTRSEAVKRGATATICQSSNGIACTADGGWEKGWIVFSDPDGDGTVDGGEEVLRVQGSLGGGLTLRTDANFEDFVSYLPLGSSRGSGGAGGGSFRLCDHRGAARGFAVAVNTIGRVSSSRGVGACP